jgi:1-deoxy-D-xylulose-5-phosphate synthase
MYLLKQINDPRDLRKLKPEQLPQVAAEAREYMIETLSKIGGHTGASLGAVELAIALHYAFATPTDKLVWDVGHQAYVHKILTGRRDQLHTIRQYNGLSGFLKRDESIYDEFEAGHAGTSLSAALGMAVARDIAGEKNHVVAVIGDSSIMTGMACEAINQAGHLGTRLIIVLNDNEMSISPSVGALEGYLTRLRKGQTYHRLKDDFEEIVKAIPGIGDLVLQAAKDVKDAIKAAIVPGVFVEDLGFRYLGPVNGHDTSALLEAFETAKQETHPVIIHALTVKGKGYAPAEADRAAWHGTSAYEVSSGKFIKEASPAPSYTAVFANALIDIMRQDEKVTAVTAAMPDGTGMSKVMKEFPKRAIDVGIAEQHAVTFCAGMATQGYKPVVAIYSTFLQRGFDQIYHDVCLMDLPVTFAMDRGGIAGADGPTHHGLLDIGYLRIMPNQIVMAPKDENELRHMLLTAIESGHPASLRYPRGSGVGAAMDDEIHTLDIGKAELLAEGSGDVAIFAFGPPTYAALKAADRLAKEGIRCTIVNARFAKPLDEDLLIALTNTHRLIVTVEEAYLNCGFGSAVLEMLEANNALYAGPRIIRLGLPDVLIPHGSQSLLHAKYGIDADAIYNRVKDAITVLDGKIFASVR